MIKNSVQQSSISRIKKTKQKNGVRELAMVFCSTCNYKGLESSIFEYTYINKEKKHFKTGKTDKQ